MLVKTIILLVVGIINFFQSNANSLCNESFDSIHNDKSDTLHLSLIVAGDIMQHDSQIKSAFNTNTNKYDYDSCFSYVSPLIKNYDIAIANLEVTLAGKPFKGYPQFSAPDELAYSLKKAGFNCLLTANNHACDRRKQGIKRTILLLDSVGIEHLGTYTDSASRAETYPFIFNKKGFKLGFLNYTFGTNGIPVPKPTIVNIIDTSLIKADLKKAIDSAPDITIVFMHWGTEYRRLPNTVQKNIAEFCLINGADFVIGSHPHVIQPMQRILHPADSNKEAIIVYSLGNYLSNQRKQYTDGGAMIGIHLSKIITPDTISTISIDSVGYYLTYVHKIRKNGKQNFYIIPVSQYENDTILFKLKPDKEELKQFAGDSRQHYNKKNIRINEFVFNKISNSYSLKEFTPLLHKNADLLTIYNNTATLSQKYSSLSFKNDTIFKIQFFVSSHTLNTGKLPKEWQNLITIETIKDTLTRYMLGNFVTYESAGNKLIEVKKEFPDAFIIKVKTGEK